MPAPGSDAPSFEHERMALWQALDTVPERLGLGHEARGQMLADRALVEPPRQREAPDERRRFGREREAVGLERPEEPTPTDRRSRAEQPPAGRVPAPKRQT